MYAKVYFWFGDRCIPVFQNSIFGVVVDGSDSADGRTNRTVGEGEGQECSDFRRFECCTGRWWGEYQETRVLPVGVIRSGYVISWNVDRDEYWGLHIQLMKTHNQDQWHAARAAFVLKIKYYCKSPVPPRTGQTSRWQSPSRSIIDAPCLGSPLYITSP